MRAEKIEPHGVRRSGRDDSVCNVDRAATDAVAPRRIQHPDQCDEVFIPNCRIFR